MSAMPAGSAPQLAKSMLCTLTECSLRSSTAYMMRKGFAPGRERAAPST